MARSDAKRGSAAKEPKKRSRTNGVRAAPANGRARQTKGSVHQNEPGKDDGRVNRTAAGTERSARDERAGTSERRSNETETEPTDRDAENAPEE